MNQKTAKLIRKVVFSEHHDHTTYRQAKKMWNGFPRPQRNKMRRELELKLKERGIGT